MKRIGLALAATLAIMTHVCAQEAGNGDTTWTTPGNHITSAGPMTMCVNGTGKAIPCTGPSGGSPSSPSYTQIQPTPVTLTNTEVTVPATTSTTLLAANPSRKMWRATNDNTGTGCRITYGVPATASLGEPVAPAGAANGQGGAYTFESSVITLQAINVYCATAGSFSVVEGQ